MSRVGSSSAGGPADAPARREGTSRRSFLARVGMLVREAAPGVPTVARLSPEQVKEHLVASSIAMAVGAP